MNTAITIGELAGRAQSAVETIRFYERSGLLPSPERSSGNYRLYDEQHVERLVFIRHCRLLDLSLDEIQALLELRGAPEKSCSEVNGILDRHLLQVGRRIAELGWLQTQLKRLRARCRPARSVRQCRILKELSHDEMVILNVSERRDVKRKEKSRQSKRPSRAVATP